MAKKVSSKKRRREPVSKPPPEPTTGTRSWYDVLNGKTAAGAVAIVLAVLWIYWPVLNGDWLWDDDYLIQNNPLVHDPRGIWAIWLKPDLMIDYFPFTVALEWLEWQIWPGSTTCYHVTNVILHICSSLLVWRLLAKFGLPLAWLGGFIFAVHPITVESVAWMAELKNTLSLPPFLIAMCAWIDFERQGKLEDYFLALLLFFVAMLCKTSMVMFPFVILLYAWYLRSRIGWIDLVRIAPFLVISVVLSGMVIMLLHHGVGEETIPLGGFLSRVACVGLSISFYFSKCFLPVALSPLYPQWPINPPSPEQFLPWLVMAGAIYLMWIKRATWGRPALLGIGFFLLNVLPFVGFRAIAFMRFGWVMDHIIYVPMLGLLGLTVAGLGQLNELITESWRPALWAATVVILGLFILGSRLGANAYVDSSALWTYTLQRFPQGWLAHNNLGNALAARGDLRGAAIEYSEALRINPDYPEAHNNLGIIYCRIGLPDAAIAEFREALRLCPELESTKINLEKVLASKESLNQ